MVVNVTKSSQKMEKINWFSIEKNIIKMRKKYFIIMIRKYFDLEKFPSL